MRRVTQCPIAVALMFVAPVFAASASAPASTGMATIPMILELDRPYVDMTLTTKDGNPVQARFWLDTGGGAILLSAGLAKQLGFEAHGKTIHEEGSVLAATQIPKISVGNLPLMLSDPRAFIVLDAPTTLQHTDAQGALPLRMLRHYQVVFDYLHHSFTIAEPDRLKPQGIAVETWIGDAGMPVVSLAVDGKQYGFLMDTGGQYCMMSGQFLDSLARTHPDWTSVQGAYGPANMLLGKGEAKLHMLRIGAMQWGPFKLSGVGAVSRRVGTYEKWMSEIAGHPIVGSVAGNVLRNFRVDIDYPASKVYLAGSPRTSSGINMVGILLEPDVEGYVIAGVSNGISALQVGDRLLKVGKLDVRHAPFHAVMRALSGKPGDIRTLEIERGGKQLRVTVPVRHVL